MQIFAKGNGAAINSTMPELTCSLLKKIVPSQVGRVMKLTTIFLFVACLHVSAKGVAQTVSLSEKDAPLQKVIKAIEAQTDYVFFYKTSWLQQAKRITIKAENIPLKEALDLCFKGQPLSYVISGKNITIEPKDEKPVEKPAIDIRGKVLGSQGEPIAGATISVKGTSKSTVTDNDGSFSLSGVDEQAVIIISHVQFETVSLSLNGRNNITATLQVKVSGLDELQVIAYGTTTRRFSTGNVTSIRAEDIQKQPVSNPLLALQGRVPGLFITQNTGVPGGGVTVRIQGQNSIQNGSDPLYIIDGVPYNPQLLNTGVLNSILGNSGGMAAGASVGVGSPLTYINPNDIESIEILKDADATAIYGSRAANGAILITTKKGKPGQRKIDVNMQTGWGQVARRMKMLNTREYLDMRYEAFQNDGINWRLPNVSANDLKIWDTTRYTDWHKELIGGTAKYTNVNSNISGGTDAFQYKVGGFYSKETTIFPGDFQDNKGGINFNVNSGLPKQKFHMQLSGSVLFDENQLPASDITNNAVLFEPIAPPLYNSDGSLNWQLNATGSSTFDNPLAALKKTYKNKTNNLLGNAILSYHILPGLEIKTSIGYTHMQTNEFIAFPLETERPENRPNGVRRAQYGFRTINSWIIEPQANYNINLFSGRLHLLIGGTINQNKQDGYGINGSGYRTDASMEDIRGAVAITSNGFSFNNIYKYNAAFARINYSLHNRYIINLNARRDGSSRFGPKSQFHNFGSMAAAWIFSEESFVAKRMNFLSFGKIRGSYGTTGNDQIGDYTFMNLFNTTSLGVPYQAVTGSVPSSHNNPYLEWEETKKLSFGIDLGFLKDRILASANYSLNKSSNQLLSYSLPISTGFSGVVSNFPAPIHNTNWEFTLSTTNLKISNFRWTSNVNLTVPKNKLVDFPDLENTSYASNLIVGEPLRINRVFKFLGVDPNSGTYLVADIHGTPTASPNFSTDRNIFISSDPKFYGGFQNSFRYKGIELDFLFQYVKQIGLNYEFYNSNREPGKFLRGFSNQPTTVLNRWQNPGDIANVQRYSTRLFSITGATDAAYSDASYIRLKNLSLSYSISDSWLKKTGLKNLRFYVLGQNLLTFTKYQGLDPENQTISSLPPLRVITAGLQLGL